MRKRRGRSRFRSSRGRRVFSRRRRRGSAGFRRRKPIGWRM